MMSDVFVCRRRLHSGLTVAGEQRSWFPVTKPEWLCGEYESK